MNGFFRMEVADEENYFLALGQWRRCAGSLRFRSRIWHDGNLRFEIVRLFGNGACHRSSWRLQSCDVPIKTHLPFRVATYVHVNVAPLRRAQQNWQPKRVRDDDVGG